jgi:hypothetical protein
MRSVVVWRPGYYGDTTVGIATDFRQMLVVLHSTGTQNASITTHTGSVAKG